MKRTTRSKLYRAETTAKRLALIIVAAARHLDAGEVEPARELLGACRDALAEAEAMARRPVNGSAQLRRFGGGRRR